MTSFLASKGVLRRGLVWSAILPIVLTTADASCQGPQWDLVWEDDFNSFDPNRWQAVTSYAPTNNSRHAYLPSQVSIDSGDLVITSENIPAGSLPYRSGLVRTVASQQFGRWEVRAKLPVTTGMWPAIWLLPDTSAHPWPSGGEIDIMENRGNQPTRTSSAFHYGTSQPYRHDFVYDEQQTPTLAGALVRYDQGYHTYAVDWTPTYLRFYVDGVNYYTVYDEDVGGFLSQNAKPMQLILNTAVGGDFLPNPNASTVWPQQFRIDSVRVFEAADQPGAIELGNPGFEENDGSLAGWTVFGNDLPGNPNVRAANEAVRTGAASLKLFGSYRGGLSLSGVSQGITVQAGDEVTATLQALVRSADALAGGNRVEMKIEFYNAFGAKHGGAGMLGEHRLVVADAATGHDAWLPHTLQLIAPEGAAEARLAIVFEQSDYDGGAIHLDDILFASRPAVPLGDYNGDGAVDAADYTVWRDALGQTGDNLAADGDRSGAVDSLDLNVWRQHFAGAGGVSGQAVPSPNSGALAGVTLLVGIGAASKQTLQPAQHD
ncbi:Beta-glucanase precursor [Pirellulimonas nuda]|uniref:Beta-glucanase n=1 Tax=Pirellulimonas nuda TaxID=2528009 RepID=A0A518D941_9BACT|nr:family 16 glycosylhydrolase [Pirellulimonas nuda]QDU87970.1 Beta-glucanase precursor [Pirellulimonas nuda]